MDRVPSLESNRAIHDIEMTSSEKQGGRTRRLLILIPLFVSVLLCWVGLRGLFDSKEAGHAEPTGLVGIGSSGGLLTDGFGEISRGEVSFGSNESLGLKLKIIGSLVDSTTIQPIQGFVRIGGVVVAIATAQGTIEFNVDSGGASIRDIRVECLGYESVEYSLDLSAASDSFLDMGVLALTPRDAAEVSFFETNDFGQAVPLVGVEVSFELIQQPTSQLVLGVSSDSGTVALALAGPSDLVFKSPDNRVGGFRIEPNDRLSIQINRFERGVQILAGPAEEPCVGAIVRRSFIRNGMALWEEAVSDEGGNLALHLEPGPNELRIVGAGVLQSVEESGVTLGKYSGMRSGYVGHQANVYFELAERDSSVVLRMDEGFIVVVCLNEASRDKVSGVVDWRLERPMDGGGWRTSGREYQGIAEDGILKLPTRLASLDEIRKYYSGARLALRIDGYSPWNTSLQLVDGSEIAALFHQEQGKWLRVLGDASSPFRNALRVAENGDSYALGREPLIPDSLGNVGPLSWNGGDLRIYDSARRLLAEVKANELRSADVVDVLLGSMLGSISVGGVPREAAPPLAVVFNSGTGVQSVTPVRGERSGEWVFENLPFGDYLVGPLDWIMSNRLRCWPSVSTGEVEVVPVSVISGRMTVIEWDSRWASGEDIRGNVRVEGVAAPDVTLVPIYDTIKGNIYTAYHGSGIKLDPSGEYRIQSGSPIPEALVVCVADPNSAITSSSRISVGAIYPGQSVALETKVLTLRSRLPAATRLVSVYYKDSALDSSIPLTLESGNQEYRWDPRVPMVLRSVPVGLETLEVLLPSGKLLIFSVSPSEDQIIHVE